MTLHSLRNTFEATNLNGRIQDHILDPDMLLVTGQVNLLAARVRSQRSATENRTSGQAIRDTFNKTQLMFKGHFNTMLSIGLCTDRALPLQWFDTPPLHLPSSVGAGLWNITTSFGCYPVAEMVLGRGQTNTRIIAPPGLNFSPFTDILALQEKIGRHGLAGLVLEQGPLVLSHRFAESGHITSASACLVGAIACRCLLQPARIMVSAVSLGMNLLLASGYSVAIILLDGLAHAVLAGTQMAGARPSSALHTVEHWMSSLVSYCESNAILEFAGIEVAPPEVSEDNEDVLGLTPDANKIVRERSYALMRWIQAEISKPEPDLRTINTIVEKMAQDLRRFCRHQPDNSALRGGLRLIKDFLSTTYEEAAEFFDPVELAEQAAHS